MDWDEIGASIDSTLDYELITVGGSQVTVLSVATFVLGVILTVMIARVLGGMLRRWLMARQELDEGVGYALGRVVQYLVISLGILISFQILGIDLSSIAIMLGALGVGIGLGLQSLASNFVSGMILLFERPVSVGDRIVVGGTEGDVVEIGMRATTIRTLRNELMIVPNSEFTNSTVVNWSRGDPKLVVWADVGVSYGSDVDTVIDALLTVARNTDLVMEDPEPGVRFRGFGDSSWNLVLWVWIADPKQHFLVASELNKAIVHEFRARNIEIPFPQRDLHWRSGPPPAEDAPQV